MPFRIREEARTWFGELQKKQNVGFSMDFDAYYFCFMAGVAVGRKLDSPVADTAELVDNFPGRYRPRGKLMIALFLSRELHAHGVMMEEKAAVHSLVGQLVDPTSPSSLSTEGQRVFNMYAHGGFDVLRDWFPSKPRNSHAFLRAYKRRLDDALADDGWIVRARDTRDAGLGPS